MSEIVRKKLTIDGLGVTFHITISARAVIAEIDHIGPKYMKIAVANASRKRKVKLVGRAFCNPEDTFSEETGIHLAVFRCYNKLQRIVVAELAKQTKRFESYFSTVDKQFDIRRIAFVNFVQKMSIDLL